MKRDAERQPERETGGKPEAPPQRQQQQRKDKVDLPFCCQKAVRVIEAIYPLREEIMDEQEVREDAARRELMPQGKRVPLSGEK